MQTPTALRRIAITELQQHRQAIAAIIDRLGIRSTARATGLNPMRISRYCSRQGADDAETHYILAAYTSRQHSVNQVK